MGGANYADYHTTKAGISRGLHEANPVVGNRIALVKGVAFGLELGGFKYIHKKNKKAAWITVGIVVVGNGTVAYLNHRKGR